MRRFSSPSAAKMWSSAELKQLRELTDAGIGIEVIASRLKRTVSAVRNKAGMHGFSLAASARHEQSRRSA
jgi:hypothetical protein